MLIALYMDSITWFKNTYNITQSESYGAMQYGSFFTFNIVNTGDSEWYFNRGKTLSLKLADNKYLIIRIYINYIIYTFYIVYIN